MADIDELGKTPADIDLGVYGARGIPSTYSGFETFLSVLLPELSRRGHLVTMYCRRGQTPALESYEGVKLVHLPATASKQFGTLAHGGVAAVAARLAAHKVVLVVNVANVPFCLAARAAGQPVVLNTDGQEWLRGKWGMAAKTYFKTAARMARFSATALVSDSRAMRDIYRSEFHADSSVIPYCWTGIGTENRPQALERLGLQPGGYFLAAARLNPENQVHLAAKAYVTGSLSQPFVVLGAANYRSPVEAALRRLAARDSRIIVAGHVEDRAEFATLVRDAAAYVHTHSIGGINPSLIEAMGSGARIVAYDNSFNREALADTGTFFKDFSELNVVLGHTVSGSASVDARWRKRAADRSRTVFGLGPVTDAYERLLTRAASGRAGARVRVATPWESADFVWDDPDPPPERAKGGDGRSEQSHKGAESAESGKPFPGAIPQ